MDLQKIVVLCIIVLVVGGAGWFLLRDTGEESGQVMERSTQGKGVPVETTDSRSRDDSLSGFGSMMDILSLGRSVLCEYTYSDTATGGQGSGVGFFNGKRMRIDSETTQDGKRFESHVINDGESLYSWTESSEGSFAFVTEVGDSRMQGNFGDAGIPEADSAVQPLDEDVSYDCRSWNVSETTFTPPSDVNFVDMSAMMEGLPNGMTEEMAEEMESMMEGLPTPQ